MEQLILTPSVRQREYARSIAKRLGERIPDEDFGNRQALSRWISQRQPRLNTAPVDRSRGATSRQVALAERLARRQRMRVPEACYSDAKEMSRWIDRQMHG